VAAQLAFAVPLQSSAEVHMARSDGARQTSGEPRIGLSVSLDHAAQLLGVSRRTIYNRIREGRLETIRTLGGSQRVLLDSVTVDQGAQAADRADMNPF
jgi:excisionase family DNA binding protein